MRHAFVILMDKWPLVHVRFPAHATDEEVDNFCEDMIPLYERGARGDPFVSIVDIRALHLTDAASLQRKRMGDRLDALLERCPRAKLGEAFVVKDDLTRLFVNVAFLLRRDKRVARKVFDDMESASAWATELLQERQQSGAGG